MTDTPPLRVVVEMATDPTWLDTLSALLTPVIAVITVYIAYQQYRVSHRQLRHEAYERRLAVYKSLRAFLGEFAQTGKAEFPRAIRMLSDTGEAVFLFEPAISAYIESIYKKTIELEYLHGRLYPNDGSPGLPVGEERSRVCEEDAKIRKWLMAQLTESEKWFSTRMRLE
jgi:hypothetical protein